MLEYPRLGDSSEVNYNVFPEKLQENFQFFISSARFRLLNRFIIEGKYFYIFSGCFILITVRLVQEGEKCLEILK